MPGADINVEKPLKVVSQTACPGYYGTSVDIGQMNAVESTTRTAAQTGTAKPACMHADPKGL